MVANIEVDTEESKSLKPKSCHVNNVNNGSSDGLLLPIYKPFTELMMTNAPV